MHRLHQQVTESVLSECCTVELLHYRTVTRIMNHELHGEVWRDLLLTPQ